MSSFSFSRVNKSMNTDSEQLTTDSEYNGLKGGNKEKRVAFVVEMFNAIVL